MGGRHNKKAISLIKRSWKFEFASLDDRLEVIIKIEPSCRNPSSKHIAALKPTANIPIRCQQLHLVA